MEMGGWDSVIIQVRNIPLIDIVLVDDALMTCGSIVFILQSLESRSGEKRKWIQSFYRHGWILGDRQHRVKKLDL